MASLLSWGSKIFDQINPFDNGLTYTQRTPTQPSQSVIRQFSRYHRLNRIPRVVRPVRDVAESQVKVVKDIATIPSALSRSIAAVATANSRAYQNAVKDIDTGFSSSRQALQAIPRQAIQLGSSVNPVGGDVYQRDTTMTNPIAKFVAGAEPIPTIQKQYKTTVQEKGGDYAKGEAALTALFDAMLARGAAKKATVIKDAVKGSKPVVAPPVSAPKPPIISGLPKEPAVLRGKPSTIAQAEFQRRQGIKLPMSKKNMGRAEVAYRAEQALASNLDTPTFMRQGQTALEQLLGQALPTTSPKQLLEIPASLGPVKGKGFTMGAPKNPAILQLGQQIAKIDRKLEQVRQGKTSITSGEIRSLIKQKQDLASQVDTPLSPTITTPKTSKISAPKNIPIKKGVPQFVSESDWQSLVKSEPKKLSKTTGGTTRLAPIPEAKLPTTIPKSPNIAQRLFESTRGELSKQGTGGAEAAKRLQNWRTGSELGQQSFLDSIPTVTKLKKEFPAFVDALHALSKGETPVMSPKVARAVKEWSANITKVQERAVASGKKVGNRGPYYFPREYSELLKTRNGFNAAVNHLVSTGQVANAAEAIQQLRFIKTGRNYGHFKAREFDIPGYDKSPKTLSGYVAGAFDDISRSEQFGPGGEISSQLLARIGQEGFDVARAQRNLDIALQNVDKSTAGHKASAGVRKLNALRSLSTSGISNATQLPVNTGTIAGIGRTIKGGVKTLVSKEARAKTRASAVTLDSAIQNLSQQSLGVSGGAGVKNFVIRNAAAPFFKQIESFNRQATATVAVDWGNSLARKAAKGDVKAAGILRDKLGVTGEIGNKLTRKQEIEASRGLVERSQFKVDPQDLPGWVDSPLGKLAAQFRTFSYKQSSFMYNEVLREAAKGNFKPLGRFIAVGVPAGATSQFIKSSIKGAKYTDDNESSISQGAKSLAAVGGFGLPGDAAQNLYKSAQYGNTPAALVGIVGGPTASFVTETGDNIRTGQQKGDWTKLKKQAVRNIPAIGPSIANRVFPKKEYGPPKPGQDLAGKSTKELNDIASREKEELEANVKPGSYGLTQLSNGKYAVTIDGQVHERSELKDARRDMAIDQLKKSGENIKIIGNAVYRKGPDGSVTTTTKTKFDYQIGTATLTQQKRAGDLDGWLETADSQLESIDKQLKDPSIDALEQITLQNQADALIENAQKYMEYGGFTKPKKGRSGGRGGRGGSGGTGALTSSFKTAGGTKAPSIPKISVRKLAAPSFKGSVRKLSVSKIPSSATTRRLS